MCEDIFKSIRKEEENRNLQERTIKLYCANVRYFLHCTRKPVPELTLDDTENCLAAKRLEGRSPETHNHYRSAIKFLCKKLIYY